MRRPSEGFIAEIGELAERFQRIADKHDWIAAAIPTDERYSLLQFGVRPPDEFPNRVIDFAVDTRDRVIIDHVSQLTMAATDLLQRAVTYRSRIPEDIRLEIRDQAGCTNMRGWIRWLWYCCAIHRVYRFDHYAEVAAIGLLGLKDHLRLSDERKRGRPPKRQDSDRDFVEAWKVAKAARVSFKEFCEDRGVRVKDGQRIKDRVRMSQKK